MNSFAPIVLFVYNRPWHTEQTVSSLQQCHLASQSKLIIYADGPKNQEDATKVEAVRAYITQIEGFEEVKIIERSHNLGLAKSVISGVSEVLDTYPTAIVLEDDLIFSRDLLTFFDQSLEVYQDRKDIYSISGYLYPIDLELSSNEAILLPRASSWAWATWRDRWVQADWAVEGFQSLMADRVERQRFVQGGEDLLPMLIRQQRGEIDSWAIRWSYTHFRQNAMGLFPAQSKVINIGTDASGTHLRNTQKYDTKLHEGFSLDPNVQAQVDHANALQRFFEPSLIRKCINWLKFRI